MEELEKALEELLFANPEFTFREAASELVKAGEIEYAVLEDPYVHAWVYKRFADSKSRANHRRLNLDI